MPNVGVILKQEIVRLSRREIRSQLRATKKASTQSRGAIAGLKRQVAALEQQVTQLQRGARTRTSASASPATPRKFRFVAKGLKSHRDRLGLSATDYGRLIGVSAQSVYNWEHGRAVPRAEQLKSIAAWRGIGKREALRRLEQSTGK